MKAKKILALILALTMALAIVACGQETVTPPPAAGDTTAPADDTPADDTPAADPGNPLLPGPFPLVNEKITLTMFMPASPINGPFDTLQVFHELEDRTNVHVEMEQVMTEVFQERLNLLIAAGPLPDVFFNVTDASNEAMYAEDGIIIPLNDLIAAHAPFLTKRFEEHPTHLRSMTSLDGNIYGTGNLCLTLTMGSYKMYYNVDIMEGFGGIPDTLDGFTDFLRYAKNERGIEYPLDGEYSQTSSIALNDGVMLAWFGETISPVFPLVNSKGGKINFIPTTEGFKEYTRYLKSLIDEGLLSLDVLTQDFDQTTAKAADMMVAVGSHLTYVGGTDERDMVLPPMTTSLNPSKTAVPVDTYFPGFFAITSACERPDVAMAWMDLFYRNSIDEVADGGFCGISMLAGRKGVEWDYMDDNNETWDYVFEREHDDDLTSVMYYLKYRGIGWGPANMWFPSAPLNPYLNWVAVGNRDYYYPYWDTVTAISAGMRFLPEEDAVITTISADLLIATLEFRARYLAGEVGEGDWDSFESQLEAIGLQQYIDTMQFAYDRFMSS